MDVVGDWMPVEVESAFLVNWECAWVSIWIREESRVDSGVPAV